MNTPSQRGKIGEAWCRSFLRAKGWKILEQNINSPYAEVDIICVRQGCLWAVEVKSRMRIDPDWIPGIISNRQTKRLRNALRWYARECTDLRFQEIRLSVAMVDLTAGTIQFFSLPPKGW